MNKKDTVADIVRICKERTKADGHGPIDWVHVAEALVEEGYGKESGK